MPVVLLSLLVLGCGSASTDQAVNTTPVIGSLPGHQRLVITTENAQRLVTASDQLFIPSGRNSVEVAAGNLSQIEINGIAGALIELPLAYLVLEQGPAGRFLGPGGGSAELALNGPALTLTFASFVARDGTVLNGTVEMIGDTKGSNSEVTVTFEDFQSRESDGAFRIDGYVTLSLRRSIGPNGEREVIDRTQHVVLTDLSNGGTVQIIDGDSEADVLVVGGFGPGGIQTGTGTNRGALLFENYQGLNGLVELVPETPYGFTIELATQASTITSGQSYLEGLGTVRRRVTAPNKFETAVRPAGATEFQVIGSVDQPI